MTAIADQQPNGQGRNHVNARAFLAGGAATTALLGGAIVLFSALAAYVAFNGIPGDPSESSTDSTVLVGTRGAPEAAARAVSRGPAAVEASPTAPTPVEPVAPPAAPTPAPAAGVRPAAEQTTIETGDGTTPGATALPGSTQQAGVLGGTVSGLENTTGNLGIDVPLGDATKSVTGPLDSALNNTLNNVGSLLGNPNLGDQVSHTLNTVTNSLLGPGGLTDQILGGAR